MVVSGIKKEDIARAITEELPFGIWCVDFRLRTITGYNKFCELMGMSHDFITFADFGKLVREDYRNFVHMSVEEIPEVRDLDITFPTNQRWVRAKLTHIDISENVAYGYLTECIFDNDKSSDKSRLVNFMEKQNQMVCRLLDKVENNRGEHITESILKDVMASTGSDRVSVVEFNYTDNTQTCTHEVTAYGVEPRFNILKSLPLDVVPWLNRELAKNEVCFVYDMDNLPNETLSLLSLLCCNNVRSMAVVPLYHKEQLVGYMFIDYMKGRNLETAERNWIRSLGLFVEYSLTLADQNIKYTAEREQLRNLISNMPFGFLQLRFTYDSRRKPVDMYISEANGNIEEMIGVKGIKGKLASQVFGKETQHVMNKCIAVQNSCEKRLIEDFVYMNGNTISAEVFMSGYSDLQCILSTTLQKLYTSNKTAQVELRENLMNRELQHLIRTNLNAILGFSELMSVEEDSGNKAKYMDIIKENAQSLLDSTFIKKSMSSSEESEAPAPAEKAEPVASDGQRKRILIAEDTESNYMLVSYILKADYELFWAHDGVEALEMYESVNPDLILMDVRMPRLGGLTATSRIRETNKTVPIIALTAFAFESDKAKTLESGCTDFVSKPINARALKEMVKKYIN